MDLRVVIAGFAADAVTKRLSFRSILPHVDPTVLRAWLGNTLGICPLNPTVGEQAKVSVEFVALGSRPLVSDGVWHTIPHMQQIQFLVKDTPTRDQPIAPKCVQPSKTVELR